MTVRALSLLLLLLPLLPQLLPLLQPVVMDAHTKALLPLQLPP